MRNINKAALTAAQEFDCKIKAVFEGASGRKNAFVFSRADQNPPPLSAGGAPRQAQQGEVVRFCRARSQIDLIGVRADQTRNLVSRLVDRLCGLPSERMISRMRIPETFIKIWLHRPQHPPVERRSRLMIKIEHSSNFHFSSGGEEVSARLSAPQFSPGRNEAACSRGRAMKFRGMVPCVGILNPGLRRTCSGETKNRFNAKPPL